MHFIEDNTSSVSFLNELSSFAGCKRKEEAVSPDHMPQPKKPRLVFTDLQRRTLQAIFKVNFNLKIYDTCLLIDLYMF